MAVFKCKICGGTLEINVGETVATCEYCGTKQTLPKLDDEKKANLFDRANHFRRNNDFDKAMGIYEQILNEDTEDAESYWSIVLCRYGIEYVEDPSSRKRVPTVNRAQFTSVFDDEDYKSAIKYADSYQKNIYEAEAAVINEIQKGILAISQKEEPFDVFICYKETDNNGRRTQDSVLATELYHELTKEGFKVFFSRITLEDKLGVAYEPYIFAALHSAKVMVALGTKPEHFNAVWVKNEWARYLSLIKNGANKILIPAYRDMDPYDLPEEFSHLQAQDMSKLGFMQDLVRGIKKLVSADSSSGVKETVVVQSAASGNASALVKRGFLALEDGEWEKADEFFEQALNQNAEDAQAYLGKLMAELKVSKEENLIECKEPFENMSNYQKALRFADDNLKKTLKGYVLSISERNKLEQTRATYASAMQKMKTATTEERFLVAATEFESILEYKNSKELAEECRQKAENAWKEEILRNANSLLDDSHHWIGKETDLASYVEAVNQLETISGYKDADEKLIACQKKVEEIKIKLEEERLKQEREREERARQAEAKQIEEKKKNKLIATIYLSIISAAVLIVIYLVVVAKFITPSNAYKEASKLYNDGNYLHAQLCFMKAYNYKDSPNKIADIIKKQKKTIAVSGAVDSGITLGLTENGKITASGRIPVDQEEMLLWENIISISTDGNHTVGLKNDGTVVAVGYNEDGRCNVSDWTDIVDISANYTTVGLRSNGTVVATGYNLEGQCNVSTWSNIVDVSCGGTHTVGLKSDGTVVAVGNNDEGACNVEEWKEIVAISAGSDYTVGLKADGTVVSTGDNEYGQCNTYNWKNIISVTCGGSHTVGLKDDGTVVATGHNKYGQCDISNWNDIVAIEADYHTVGLKSDGTVVAVGSNKYGQCNLSNWNNLKMPWK